MTAAERVVLAERPTGVPGADTFRVEPFVLPPPAKGEFAVRVDLLSLAPAMRGWLDPTPTYRAPLEIGEAIPGRALGQVVASRNDDFPVGATVSGPCGMATAAVSDGTGVVACDLDAAPAPTWLGLLDTNGLTAYFGLFDVGRLRPGDTVLVSGAAGGVGSVVVQLARLRGAGRVVAVAGGSEPCRWLRDELGVDVVIDHRELTGQAALEDAVAQAAPEGIDVFFDNVGGPILDAALEHLAVGARVVICGAISGYNRPGAQTGPHNYLQLLFRRATMAGFITSDFAADHERARGELAAWHRNGDVVAREYVVAGGIGDFPSAFARLFTGNKPGKLVLDLTRSGAPRAVTP